MDVSIIIVNYNTLQMTSECIESVREHTQGVEYEIILVDNASTDGSVEFFSHYSNIIFIPNKENYGFGKANNIGAKVAKGKYLFLLNSDTYLIGNIILCFYQYYEANTIKGLACVGSSMLGKDLKPALSGGHFPSLMQEFSSIGFFRLYKKTFRRKWSAAYTFEEETIQKVDYVMGADWFIKKIIFDKFQGFDEHFFMYFEESELAKRMSDNGQFSVLLPNQMIVHLGGVATGKSFSENKFRIFMKSKAYYFRKHGGRMHVFFMKLFSATFHIIRPYFWKHLKSILTIIYQS